MLRTYLYPPLVDKTFRTSFSFSFDLVIFMNHSSLLRASLFTGKKVEFPVYVCPMQLTISSSRAYTLLHILAGSRSSYNPNISHSETVRSIDPITCATRAIPNPTGYFKNGFPVIWISTTTLCFMHSPK